MSDLLDMRRRHEVSNDLPCDECGHRAVEHFGMRSCHMTPPDIISQARANDLQFCLNLLGAAKEREEADWHLARYAEERLRQEYRDEEDRAGGLAVTYETWRERRLMAYASEPPGTARQSLGEEGTG